MREIKFRGKHDGKWLYGYLDCNFKGRYTINDANKPFRMAVDDKTIGQYTSMKDCNGKEIYEGDIVNDGESCDCVESIGTVEFNQIRQKSSTSKVEDEGGSGEFT